MSLSMYQASVPAFLKMLGNLTAILEKAEAFAAERKLDETVLLNWRLAPDMYPLMRQIQIAADFAKGTTARLAGAEVPKSDDTEKSFADIKQRIAKTAKFVEGFRAADIDGSEQRDISIAVGDQELQLQGRALSRAFRPAEFLLPRHHRLRHFAGLRRRDRQARLHGRDLARHDPAPGESRGASSMNLVWLLNSVSPWLTAFVVLAVAEIFSVGLMLASRAYSGSDRLSLDDEVAGFKFAVVGVLYAVMLAFVVIAVWEEYRDTEAAVRNEAKALIDLQQLSHAMPEPAATTIRQHLSDYIGEVRANEWQTMAEGTPSAAAEGHLQRLSQAIFNGSPSESRTLPSSTTRSISWPSSTTIETSAWIVPTARCRVSCGSYSSPAG